MYNEYTGVTTRFLRDDERFILSEEKEMPLVIEAHDSTSAAFLQQFLASNNNKIIEDLANYGAILLRGFAINSDKEFEQTILSLPNFQGISEAFMSENGRTHVGELNYVLHTNSVYKTGGTLYLGGFHTENYYSADVPAYICFYCAEPSTLGGETGIISTEKIYGELDDTIKNKLENCPYFVGQWLVTEVASRYQISPGKVEEVCRNFDLPLVGAENERFILMHKPSVFEHPLTKEKALQINLFELPTLNKELRQCFMQDYPGRTWFWHRFFWRLPTPIFNTVESLAVMGIAFFNSPRNAWKIIHNKLAEFKAKRKNKLSAMNLLKVGSCFSHQDVKKLAKSMRKHYSSCIWQKGDILLIDNRKVMHAGMPGMGHRTIRAIIGNPVQMKYDAAGPGCISGEERSTGTIGAHLLIKKGDTVTGSQVELQTNE